MKKNFHIGFAFAAATVLLGDLLLRLDFSGNALSDLLGFALAVLASFATLLLLKGGVSYIQQNGVKFGSALSLGADISAFLLLLLSALYTVWNFSAFAGERMLKTDSVLLPFVTFALLTLSFVFLGKKTIYKLGVILFPLVALIIVAVFVFSLRFMSIKYLIPYKALEIKETTHMFMPAFCSLVSAVIPLAFFEDKNGRGGLKTGFFLGCAGVITALINVIGIFGSELASLREYPYPDAISVASMGDSFSRMDGFIYLACFFTCFLKAGMAFFAAGQIARKRVEKILYQK